MSGIPADPPPFPRFPVVSSDRIHRSHWCELRRDWIELDDGARQEYLVFEVAAAVCVVPVLPDGSIVTLWQFRHPHGETHWEIPAGRVDEDEEASAAAARELLEETGYRPGRLERLAGFYPINGISPHHAQIFVAHDCQRVREPEHDASERMSVHVLPEAEVRARLERGDFVDAFTSLALFHYFARM